MKCRYIVLKKLYNDYIIIFIKNNKYVLYGIDNYIGNVVDIYSLSKYGINNIVVDNLDIISINKFDDNKYYSYMIKGIIKIALINTTCQGI